MTRERNSFGKLDCPQPGCRRTGEEGFDGPQGLGSHMKTVHGIAGTSASTLSARQAKVSGTPEPNTWGKYDCPDRHCDRKGQSGLPTPQALGRHRQAKHDGSDAPRSKRREGGLALARRQPQSVHEGDGGNGHVAVSVEPATPHGHADPLHYCPGCGFDLDAAKQHLHPSVRAHAYIRCPRCRTNLAVVGAVLRPDIQSIPPEHAMALVEAARRVSTVL